MKHIHKMTLSGVFIALGVVTGSILYIPIGVIKAFPVQHVINVLSAILLGPFYAVANAFLISLIRNFTGVGSLLAFPGSMIGAWIAASVYKKWKKVGLTFLGEWIGTGIVGAVIASLMAKAFLGSTAPMSIFLMSFLASSLVGAGIAVLLYGALSKAGLFSALERKNT
jgi:energy coupling factor transporter S component ThiW